MPEEEIYSEETHEIINTPPKWLIRWGALLIFVLVMALLILSFFIQYPDVVSGNVFIETKEPLLEVECKSEGKIIAINVADNSRVSKGDTLMIIENNVDTNAISYIRHITTTFQNFISEPESYLNYVMDTTVVLGEVQNDYNSFVKNYNDYSFLVSNSVYENKIISLHEQLKSFKNIYKITQKQIEYSQKDYQLQKTIYESEQELYNKGASTKYDYISAETKFINLESSLEGLKKQSIEYTMRINEYTKQIIDLKIEKEQKYRVLIYDIHNSITAMQNYLINWSKNFQLISPINGTVYYRKTLFINEKLNNGDLIFNILPNSGELYARVGLQNLNLRKVEIGQKVRLELDEYPSTEYGYIEGKVSKLSVMPKDSLYEVILELPNNLNTTRNKSIPFKPLLKGKAEIITKSKSVFNRIMEKFNKLISR